MEENKENLNKNNLSHKNTGPWWASGVEIFSQVSTWIVVPVVLALVLGKMLDTRYGTKPIIFLSLTGLAFLFSCFKIVYIIKNYMKKLQDKEMNDKK